MYDCLVLIPAHRALYNILLGGYTVDLPWITLYFCTIMEQIEARENEMGDQLARLLADNVSKNAEIQNLYIRVLGRVEG